MISFHCSLLKLEMCLLLNAVSSIWQISQQQNCFDDRIKCWRQLPTTPIECRRVSRYFEVLGRKLFVCNLSRCGLVCVCVWLWVPTLTHSESMAMAMCRVNRTQQDDTLTVIGGCLALFRHRLDVLSMRTQHIRELALRPLLVWFSDRYGLRLQRNGIEEIGCKGNDMMRNAI